MRRRKPGWWPMWANTPMSPWPSWARPGRRRVGDRWAKPASGRCWMSRNYGEKKSLHASERDTPRVGALRQDFVETVAQHYDTRRFHFLDETGLRLDA